MQKQEHNIIPPDAGINHHDWMSNQASARRTCLFSAVKVPSLAEAQVFVATSINSSNIGRSFPELDSDFLLLEILFITVQ